MDHLLISSRKGLITYSKSNGHWKYDSLHFKGIPVCLSFHDKARDVLWAFQDHGHWGIKIHKSGDFGATWQEVSAMKYPEGAEVKEGKPAALNYIWSADIDVNGRMWIGTVPGGLFYTDDGIEFQLNEALWDHPHRQKHWFGGGMDYPGIHSIICDPKDSDHMYVGISVGGVYETRDGGQTWDMRNKGLRADFMPDPNGEFSHDPHLLVTCPSNRNVMWQQNHCGIFKSIDGAASWEDVSQPGGPANFGFVIEVDESNPEGAWVVPGVSDEIRVAIDEALCVCRTEDGGKSWQAFRNGLPQQGSFDIVYRHAMARNNGDMFFGTTTGNLFHSVDAGESWQSTSNYLPLINAVTFAEH